MSVRQRLIIGCCILFVGAFLRLWQFGQVPPGLQHDEIFKAEEGVTLIEQGDFRLFYPTNQGHEGAFVWLLGMSYLIVGANALMIKLPAFVCGMLTIALSFRFGYQHYSPLVGIVTSGLFAVSFWAVFTSRLGLRAIMLPMIVLLVLLGISRLLNTKSSQTLWLTTILTGLALGLAIYTYTSAFALHVAYAVFFIGLVIFGHKSLRPRWREFLGIGIIGLLLTLPMVCIRLTDPQGINRASSIATPLEDAREGNPRPLFDNTLKLTGMPAFVGDPTWRYNIPGRPLFLLPIGLLVYVGFSLVLIRMKQDPMNLMLITLTLMGMIPSLLTVLAPSFLRSIVTLPAIIFFIGIALHHLHQLIRSAPLIWGLVGLIIVATGIVDYHAYFVKWTTQSTVNLPYHDKREQGEKVYQIYRDDLEQLADYISDIKERVVFVSTPNRELDPLIYKYYSDNDDTQIVFFDAFANIVLSIHEAPALLFVSPLSPISEKHQKWLTDEYGTSHIDTILRQDGELAFDVYLVGEDTSQLTQALTKSNVIPNYVTSDSSNMTLEYPVNFGNIVLLQNVEIPRKTVYRANDGVNNQLYLEPLVQPSRTTLSVFLHLIADTNSPPVAQRDLLGVSPAYWHPNTIIIQDNFVPFWESVPAGEYLLTMGIYDVQTGQRIPVVDSNGNILSDYIILSTITVQERPQ